ncbi:LptA/OstA family protein [Francisella sp. 19X1-34]|uniref:LptA/OstA family protein n=1 Tax=Francisella sp. 19X1-34 TaxID=3087177 RepID=UPI002E353FF9|nr:LptA/OstA family protein [Francisella sp. 19X1-34]MED7788441.1 LptA/OstA family protein [Francisella sp. 19X1-34]
MRQAKLLLVALGLFSLFNTSFAISSTNSSAIEKEDNVTANEKEDDSADNVFKEYGPITICSDRAVYEANKNRLTYYDNVFVMQIHHKHILCHKPHVLKQGVQYFVRDKKYSFSQLQEKWLEEAKKLCDSEKECNFISGQKLVVQLNKDKKVQTLTMETEGLDRSQFYTFPTNSSPNFVDSEKITRGPVGGVAKKIIYNVVKKDLELDKKAKVIQHDNKYRGEKIIYDIKHDLVSIPGSVNRRSTIVLEGVTKATRVKTGLKPISEYHKAPKKTKDAGIVSVLSN